MDVGRRLSLAVSLLLIIFLVGIFGYVFIEGWTLLDALYMTVVTISTVGFKEVAPLSQGGRLFTLGLIVLGVGTVLFTLGTAMEFFVEGHLTGLIEERKMKKRIEALRDHYILCGYGRVGREVAKEFLRTGTSFVVIENNSETILKCREDGLPYIEGDAAADHVLKEAGIDEAKGLVAAVDTDADNVFVALTARVLNPEIFIVARANFEESEEKLRKAGADRVISPTVIGGRRMASLLLKPLVCDYLDVVAHGESIEYRLEEVHIKKQSPIVNTTIGKAGIREKTGALILAIKKAERGFDTNPPASTTLEEGDELVVMGTREQLNALQSLL